MTSEFTKASGITNALMMAIVHAIFDHGGTDDDVRKLLSDKETLNRMARAVMKPIWGRVDNPEFIDYDRWINKGTEHRRDEIIQWLRDRHEIEAIPYIDYPLPTRPFKSRVSVRLAFQPSLKSWEEARNMFGGKKGASIDDLLEYLLIIGPFPRPIIALGDEGRTDPYDPDTAYHPLYALHCDERLRVGRIFITEQIERYAPCFFLVRDE